MSARAGFLAAACGLLLALGCRATGDEPAALPFELALEFEGELSVDAEKLAELVRAELVRLEVATPDKAAIDDAAFALELFYRARGHHDVRVDYEFDPAGPSARFVVTEGPVVRIRALTLEGTLDVSLDSVRSFLGAARSGGLYDEERLRDALAALRTAYHQNGRLAAEIGPLETEFDAERTSVDLHLAVREGPRFVVRAVEFEGGAPELAERERKFASSYTDSTRNQYKTALGPELQNALTEEYKRRGYPDASVEVRAELDETSGDVRLVVKATPGDRVTIAHIRIEGNQRTKDAAILALMGIDLGERYDSEQEREAFRELYATGLFETIAIQLEGTGSERTMVVTVAEARSVQIRLEPGWGSYEGPRLGLGIEENNFQGRGQVLSLDGAVSLKARSLRASWVDRDFLGTNLTSQTTAFVEEREEPSFTYLRRGFGFFLRREWTDAWSSSLGYEYRPTNVTDEPNVPLPPDVESDTNVAALSTGVVYEDRDNVLLPTHGRHGFARFEWADDGFGSDTEFLRAQFEFNQLFKVGESVLAASARTGVIAPFGLSEEIPLPERFFNGGENSVRSFKEDELLPEGRFGDPTGGEAATTLNLELRRELTGNLAGALFVDLGNVTEEVQDYLEFDGFRSGLGVGIRYLLPIGPVRLDLGWNPNTKTDPFTLKEEDEYVLHFSVGFPF